VNGPVSTETLTIQDQTGWRLSVWAAYDNLGNLAGFLIAQGSNAGVSLDLAAAASLAGFLSPAAAVLARSPR